MKKGQAGSPPMRVGYHQKEDLPPLLFNQQAAACSNPGPQPGAKIFGGLEGGGGGRWVGRSAAGVPRGGGGRGHPNIHNSK